MKAILFFTVVAILSAGSAANQLGKVESMIREHIGRCEADGLSIPVIEVSPELFGKLVSEVGWERVLGSHGQRRWVVFETPDPTRKSGKRYFRVERYPTPEPKKPIDCAQLNEQLFVVMCEVKPCEVARL